MQDTTAPFFKKNFFVVSLLSLYLFHSAFPSSRTCTRRCSHHPVRSSSRRLDTGRSRRPIAAVLKNTHQYLTVFH